MKYLFIVLFLFLSATSLFAQSDEDQQIYDIMRKRLRVVDDPIFVEGDTLYLLYDLTDSLQFLGTETLRWMKRGLTREERKMLYSGEDYIGHDLSLFLRVYKKFKTFSFDKLMDIPLVSREEYLAFYHREYKRLGGRMRLWSSYLEMDFTRFNPLYYFKKVYIIVPEENKTFRMYTCSGMIVEIV